MEEHPIEGLMITAMNSIKDMVDVDTIIGEPIETKNNVVIIPISKVTFGFAAGGSEFRGEVVEGYSKTNEAMLTGRTDGGKVVNFVGEKDLIGEMVELKITEQRKWYLTGEII